MGGALVKTEKEKLFDQYIDKWVDKTYLSIWKMKIHYLSYKAYRKETENEAIPATERIRTGADPAANGRRIIK